jgi:hypothetical protein
MAALSEAKEWTPWFGLEIYSYYMVGFVTCLEWHARSRLVDLFNHLPECVLADDLKGHINDRVLSQMAAAKVGVPEMLGALLSVGSVEAYLSTILRVFKARIIGRFLVYSVTEKCRRRCHWRRERNWGRTLST